MKSRKREGTTDSASKTGVLEPVSQIVSRSNPGQLISEVLRSNANKPERISCFEEETNILVSIDLDSMHASDTSRAGTNECFQLTSRNKRVLSTISNTRASFYQPGFRYQFQSGTAQEVAHQKNQYENPSFQPESVFLVLCIRGMGSALWKQKLFVRVKQADSQLRILEENSLALHLN